ncbi:MULTISPECIES: thymidine kinase [unclassified Lentilitoribacter]|uniref:thymidine kinase n=1 Tax=unclassified Lentilitoribacter TaxID=2647570 RepID=UPI0013A6A915|nr:thymidine kinase [Lentilitoribacter sp. Alg239-R112]
MAKLYFSYASMNAGKSTLLLQASYNYQERGMRTVLLNASLDNRAGSAGKIGSRIGLESESTAFEEDDNLYEIVKAKLADGNIACVFVDEANFMSAEQAWQLSDVVDDLNIPVMAYGLRTDFQGKLFPGSKILLSIADEIREVRTICDCGRKATMVVRQDGDGNVVKDGAQIVVGGNESYVSYCRQHWKEAIGYKNTND